jgi:hypothetical protein
MIFLKPFKHSTDTYDFTHSSFFFLASEDESEDMTEDEEIAEKTLKVKKKANSTSEEDSEKPLTIKKKVKKNVKTTCEEDSTSSDEDEPKKGITVVCSSKSGFKKTQFCTFCSKGQDKIVRHLEEQHSKESEVKMMKRAGNKTAEKKKLIGFLKYRGNHEHNLKVIDDGFGDFIVGRRPPNGAKVNYLHYAPCPDCLEYLTRTELYRHKKNGCKFISLHCKRSIRDRSTAILLESKGINRELSIVLSGLKKDAVYDVIISDPTILLIGKFLMEGQVDHERMAAYYRERLRETARLLILLRKREGCQNRDIKSFITVCEFDNICDSVKKACLEDENEKNTLALKFGHALVKLCEVLWGQYIRVNDKVGAQDCTDVHRLYDNEWKRKISGRALKKMKHKKLNQKIEHIRNGDVKKLSDGLKKTILKYYKLMQENPTVENGRRLHDAIMTYLILFNR